MQNPFTLTFGKSPLEPVERPVQTNEIVDAFTAESVNQQMFIITGVRGSGKTVMMTEIARRLREKENWVVIEHNASNSKAVKIIINKYKNIFGTDRDTAEKMAELTKGYPFAFQVLGYLTWNHSGHYEVVIDEYEQYLSEFVYDKIWSELSQKDRIVARGIAETESGKIKEIREHLGMETNEFNPYRKRLIKKGIVSGETRGYVFFTLPLFERYVIDNS